MIISHAIKYDKIKNPHLIVRILKKKLGIKEAMKVSILTDNSIFRSSRPCDQFYILKEKGN
jgi:hypothetical protein